jgi:hypothetical protein
VVLLAQDTTDLIHTITKGPKGLGTLKETEKRETFLHPTIAITPHRLCLGVVGADIWERIEPSPKKERRNKPINEKESVHWLEGYQTACEVAGTVPETLIEAKIFACKNFCLNLSILLIVKEIFMNGS